jgi:hypothetical protein
LLEPVEPVLGVLGLVGLVGLTGAVVLPEVEPEVDPEVPPEVPPVIPELLLPELESCFFRQSLFAVPLRPVQLESLLAPLAELGLVVLLELGVELDPLLLDELGVEVLGLELELPLEVCETDTVANVVSAAAMAMPSAFFIMDGLLRSWGKVLRPEGASAVPCRGFVVKSRAGCART